MFALIFCPHVIKKVSKQYSYNFTVEYIKTPEGFIDSLTPIIQAINVDNNLQYLLNIVTSIYTKIVLVVL